MSATMPTAQELEKMDISQLQEVLQKMNPQSGKDSVEKFSLVMEYVLKKGAVPKTALKISDNTMEAVYTQAYNLYNQGKYKEASYLFRFLMLLDLTTSRYILGLAACLHRMKDYKNAANLYFFAGALDDKNPLPHYHATDCYLQLNKTGIAIISLQMAISAAGSQEKYKVIKERSQLLKENLMNQFKAEKAEKSAQPEKSVK
jgi:type III secretion system low calcium response chaperone LcrH/SycD